MGAPAARASELARHWVQAGHDVTVLTGFPNHPTGVVPPEWRPKLRRLMWREDVEGIHVVRTWLWPLPNRKAHERMRSYASFCISAAITGMGIARPDLVIGSSPQLLVALAAWWTAAWKRVPFVFEVRDLWPESLQAVGAADEKSLLHGVLGAVAGFLYQRADKIVVVTPAFKEHLIHYWKVPGEKISIVPNGVETDLFAPQSAESDRQTRASLGMADKFVVCYSGTMGMAHGLDTLLEASRQLRDRMPTVQFLLVGEGADKERIVASARANSLSNLTFLDQQPREKIPALISASHACLVLLKKSDVFKTVIPTKMLEFMACARPVIVGVDGQARQIVEDARAGIVIEPENAGQLAQAIDSLAHDAERARQMGTNGRAYIQSNYSRQETAGTYIGVLSDLVR